MMKPPSKRQERILTFVQFCLDYPIEVSIILWLLIISFGVLLWRAL